MTNSPLCVLLHSDLLAQLHLCVYASCVQQGWMNIAKFPSGVRGQCSVGQSQ